MTQSNSHSNNDDRGTWGGRLINGLGLTTVAALALVNGQPVSPLFDAVAFYVSGMVPAALRHPDLVFHATTPVVAGMTFALSGVPAALVERARAAQASTPLSLAVWVVTAAALSLPGILGLLGHFQLE